MNLVCDKCGSKDIYTVQTEPTEELPKKMSEVSNMGITTLVYRMTTLRCKNCGFEHSY